MEIYYIWILLFIVAAYLIITDSSISQSVYYISKLFKFQYEKIKWWLINNPKNPIVKYLIWKRAMKMAKELEEEFKRKNKN